ncbi:hypothetical protein Gotri_006844 [Gossypium trilobum]|uniref:non-specific serine/threonine protein kinase n=1 Tax=Gossypium trilobum TaxID=34281 RepID=A0A7J9FTE3_9ROSI|nr:hypothetical protein [Gossypium trilobum]
MEKKGRVLMGKFELGRLLGQGTFAKVYYARNTTTGLSCAIKIIDKEKIMKGGLIDQIKREISVMRLVKHPNVVRLYEVMASKSKIYFVMEYVKGGELFGKVAKGKLKENDARQYFQQLIAAVDYCHSRGVYHRDLKPENLLVDENGNLKVSDFGLSALRESRRQDGLLHTTCGTPAYVAPEVINMKGYDGAKVDIWSCGVILYVLLAGFLPFHDENLMELYKKITKGEFRCPQWLPPEVPFDEWSSSPLKNNDDTEVEKQQCILRPSFFNAFDLISLSEGFDLSGLFKEDLNERDCSRFTTQKPATDIVSKFEQIARTECFRVTNKGGKVRLRGVKEGRKGLLAIDAEIFEVTPSFYVVEMTKTSGDTLEYKKFCNQELRPSLNDIVWAWQGSWQQQPNDS